MYNIKYLLFCSGAKRQITFLANKLKVMVVKIILSFYFNLPVIMVTLIL